jgi:hypothetical protein
MLRISRSLEYRLTDGGKVVSLMQRPRWISQKHYSSVSDTYFC